MRLWFDRDARSVALEPKLSMQYRVTAYPTLLFIDGEGNMIKKAVGYHPAPQLIELGRSVISQKS